MIGVGAEAIEARSVTSDLTDWHQALARVSAAEEEARTVVHRVDMVFVDGTGSVAVG
jgi:hypothetical protein